MMKNMSGRVEVEATEPLSRQQGSVAALREEGQTSRSKPTELGPTPWQVVTASGPGGPGVQTAHSRDSKPSRFRNVNPLEKRRNPGRAELKVGIRP